MKIAIVSAIWKREALSRIFLNSVKRYWKDFGIQTMIAGSEGVRSREMCLDAGAGYVEITNNPVSNKFNRAAQMAIVSYQPDALLILGSDDFVNSALIEKYIISLKQGYDVVGITDCYYYHTESKEAGYWWGYPESEGKYNRIGETIGMARMLSRKVFERLKAKMWPTNMNSGLDWNLMHKIKRVRELRHKAMRIKDTDMVAVDIKGQQNITEFGCYRARMDIVDTSVFNTIPEFYDIQKL